jgi:DNA-binding MarR family transcriptional regulator
MTRNAALTASLSLAELIVVTLRRYGSISVDFLARVLDQRTSDVEEYVDRLEREGVVMRSGNEVSLVAATLRKVG